MGGSQRWSGWQANNSPQFQEIAVELGTNQPLRYVQTRQKEGETRKNHRQRNPTVQNRQACQASQLRAEILSSLINKTRKVDYCEKAGAGDAVFWGNRRLSVMGMRGNTALFPAYSYCTHCFILAHVYLLHTMHWRLCTVQSTLLDHNRCALSHNTHSADKLTHSAKTGMRQADC